LKLVWLGRIVSGLAALPFAMSAAMKFTTPPEVLEGMAHLGDQPHRVRAPENTTPTRCEDFADELARACEVA
jgi:hypothetical protein